MAELGLYIHLPFCPSRCPYCDFAARRWDQSLARRLLPALHRHLEALAPAAGGRRLASLYIGGGTPSMWPARELAGLIAAARALIGLEPGAEVTVEANPGALSPRKLELLASAGATRLSLGAQSLDDGLLAALGRRHGAEHVRRAAGWARRAGLGLGLDLIYGLPGQTPAQAGGDVARALELAPEHLSLYELTLAPETPFGRRFRRGRPPMPGEEAVLAMEARARGLAAAAGLARYEVSNFARPGAECRHNLSTWAGGDYLALGPGAHGHLAGTRWAWLAEPAAYCRAVEAGDEPAAFRERLSARQRALELAMLGFRTAAGVDLAAAGGLLGRPAEEAWAGPLAELEARGWARRRGGRLVPTGLGLDMADAAAALFA
jgi:oxygen-independent coproporphyrinogen-3 oxidase